MAILMKAISAIWPINSTEGWTTIRLLWVINLNTRTKCYCNPKWVSMMHRPTDSIRIQAVATSILVVVWQTTLESAIKTQFHTKETQLNRATCTINSTWTHKTPAMDMAQGRPILIQVHLHRWWEIWIRATWCLITIQATTRWARINSNKCSTTLTAAFTCHRTTRVGFNESHVEATVITFLCTGSTQPICINKLGQILLENDQSVPMFNNSH